MRGFRPVERVGEMERGREDKWRAEEMRENRRREGEQLTRERELEEMSEERERSGERGLEGEEKQIGIG